MTKKEYKKDTFYLYKMDDFITSNLQESRNEWSARLVTILNPLVTEGLRSIFNEAWNLCVSNDEANKYLMTFQNLLSRIPKWNPTIIEEERNRIIQRSGCNYLEDLIMCVHVIQLKLLTCIRVSNKQKKIDISIPKLDDFIHKVYINAARKIYSNVYLFEKSISPLQLQKHNRELEVMINECILSAIRDSIPTEQIIRAYLDETVEQEEEIIIEKIPDELPVEKPIDAEVKPLEDDVVPEVVPSIQNLDDKEVVTRLSFNDMDSVLDSDDQEKKIDAPKTIERLEEISTSRALQRKLEEQESDDDDDRIKIHTDGLIDLSGFEELDNDKSLGGSQDFVLDDFEVL